MRRVYLFIFKSDSSWTAFPWLAIPFRFRRVSAAVTSARGREGAEFDDRRASQRDSEEEEKEVALAGAQAEPK